MYKMFFVMLALASVTAAGPAQVRKFSPVTPAMLLNPPPDDCVIYSRTYDPQRYSPLNQIHRQNVGRLTQVWSNALPAGTIEIIPMVHSGVMYAAVPSQENGMPRTAVQALDATTGGLIWEYKRPAGGVSRAKSLGIFEDLILFAAPDGFIVALDARTGQVRWETKSSGSLTSGTIVFGDKVVSGRSCTANGRVDCYIVAHDAKTGKEVWRFYTAAGSDDPVGDASWGGTPEAVRAASPWGLGGSYDPVRKTTYWGVANPTPYTRAARHSGNVEAVSRHSVNVEAVSKTAPADLYSNSTVALIMDTGIL